MATLWLDGQLLDETHPVAVSIARRTPASTPSCYTAARVTAGRAHHPDHHVRRLQRDAKAIGLDTFDPFLVYRAFEELGRGTSADGTCVVRIEAMLGARGAGVSLAATSRSIGIERDTWTAITAPMSHPGPTSHSGAKLTGQRVYEDARAASNKAGVDEALLFDENTHLVEGARTNLLVVDSQGTLAVPDPALGAVAGIALEIVKERVAELEIGTFGSEELADARELIAVNAVRGARSIVELDGRRIGSGSRGPWAERLDSILADPQ